PTLRRPPYPPLFPYTTLFRSPQLDPHRLHDRRRGCDRHRADEGRRPHSGPRRRRLADLEASTQTAPGPPYCPRASTRATSEGTTDRKSTRLNSSHVAISYAVF